MKKRDKSKLVNDLSVCFICKRKADAIHEVFFGTANRKKSIEDGMYLGLCNSHHNMSNHSAHKNREVDLFLKRFAQEKWEINYIKEHCSDKTDARIAFIERFGKSWL